MNIIYLEPDDLTEEEIDFFYEQHINMDDWDYMLLLPKDTKVTDPMGDEVTPENYYLENLLHGCCSNHWYFGEYKGEKYVIGIAYHS